MEGSSLVLTEPLGLLLLPLVAMLLMALCVRCRELPANSVASYENQEPACEDADEDEDEEDYPNDGYGGYVEVLPDGAPAPSSGVDPVEAPVPSKSGLRDRAVSVEFREDYVNVPESEESAEASLDGSREYVNVSQELQPAAGAVPGEYGVGSPGDPLVQQLQAGSQPLLPTAALSTQEDEDEDEDEGEDGDAPDYENLQELS
ncbi:Linker for activation of T-cells family member 1 [Fukomys damarensis]|uniref:Linker for activation of T-cells family member 1 n=1 Tax=Fukomys damarensis TaxID=885580 RepID=A0A091DR20_FUKDA|nr:Linker for activation of T-cells family member 1 [Fukomys damarensis]